MALRSEFNDLEQVLSLFPPGSAKAIQRLLQRAQDKAVEAARRDVEKAMRGALHGVRSGSEVGKRIAAELARALAHRGAPRKGAPSIKPKAAAEEGGGRSFHFAHSFVSKGDPTEPVSSKARKTGAAAAHMRYIERETAVEMTARRAPDVGANAEQVAERRDRKMSRGRDDDGRGREVVGNERTGEPGPMTSSAAAHQGYTENPVKLASGDTVLYSFGNIGETFEERLHFWTALEAAEARPRARVQYRLIVELPHEATPEARFEIVKLFVSKFEKDSIPFWAALHAPGKKNDARNYHAHIVYSDRPAKRVVDPADDLIKWDFEVIKRWKDSSRHTRTSRPERQNKNREYGDDDFIPVLRKRFADAANTVLERDNVRDATGDPVRYDHRSYKDMEIDVAPTTSINRVVADKVKGGTATVLDRDYTRRMVAAEIRSAAQAGNQKLLEQTALDDALREVVANPARASLVNPRLPSAMRVSPLRQVSKDVARIAAKRLMEAGHAALLLDTMEEATTASLNRIIEATDPKVVAAAALTKDAVVKAAAPDPATAALLHEAAREELDEIRSQAARERRSLGQRNVAAIEAWRAAVGPPRPETSSTIKAAITAAVAESTRSPEAPPGNEPPGRPAPVASRDDPSAAQKMRAAVPSQKEQSAATAFGAEPSPTMRAAMKAVEEVGPWREEAKAADPPRARAEAKPQAQPGARQHAQHGPEAARPSEPIPQAPAIQGKEKASSRADGQKAGPRPHTSKELSRTSTAEASATQGADGAATVDAAKPKGVDPEALKKEAEMCADLLMRKTLELAQAGGAAASAATSADKPRGRPPTPAEAEAVSAGIGQFIQRIRGMTPTVEERLAMLQLWTTKPIFKATPAGPEPLAEEKAEQEGTRSTTERRTDQATTHEASAEPATPTKEAETPDAQPPAPATPEPRPDLKEAPPLTDLSITRETTGAPDVEQNELEPTAASESAVKVSVERKERSKVMIDRKHGALSADQPKEMGILGVPRLAPPVPDGPPEPQLPLSGRTPATSDPDHYGADSTSGSRQPASSPESAVQPLTVLQSSVADQTVPPAGAFIGPESIGDIFENQSNIGGSPRTPPDPGKTDVVNGRKRQLVIDYALVLLGYKAWSNRKADLLASLISLSRDELWIQAHQASKTRYRKRFPADIAKVDLEALHRETWRAAKEISFEVLLHYIKQSSTGGRDEGERRVRGGRQA